MSKGKKKKEEAGYNTRVNESIENVKTLSPFAKWQGEQSQKWINYKDGTGEYAGKPRNIADSPGFSDVVDLYGANRTATQMERQGGGALNLADPSQGAYASQQKQLNDFNYSNNRAENISNAVRTSEGNALGRMDTLIDRDINRKNTVAGLEMNNRNAYYNRPQKRGFWGQLAKFAIGGASGFARSAATGGAG